MSQSVTRPQNFWQRVITPHPSVTGELRRRRTQLLAILSLLVLAIGAILAGVIVIGTRLVVPAIGWISTAVLLAASYGLSRSRWPEIGAGLITFGQIAAAIGLLFSLPLPEIVPQVLIFLLVPMLIAILVLQARWTLVLALLTIIGMSAYVISTPAVSFEDIAIQYSATVILTALIAGAAFIRERDVSTIEQQSQKADQYSKELENDVRRISAVTEVGRAITGTRDLNVLLNQVVNLIIDQFDFYHAQVFLLDEIGQNAILKASTGEAGQKLLARGHSLPVGSQSVIGQVTSHGGTVIAADTDIDAIHRRNELLPYTRAEMALPLRVAGRIIGALDVQAVEPDAFRNTDISIFQAMADQLAIAIENARLFEQARRDLQDIERLNRQLTGEAWRQYIDKKEGSTTGFQATDAGIAPVSGDEDGQPTLSVPLQVRGQTIGLLDISARDGSEPDEDTRQMLEAVAERVALALDSTRLSEQAQQQAVREQILSRLSAELQATTDLKVILRIAAREASRALDVPQSFVHLMMSYQEPGEREADSDIAP